jgi:predicted tellurium resistance membrane protein TerC
LVKEFNFIRNPHPVRRWRLLFGANVNERSSKRLVMSAAPGSLEWCASVLSLHGHDFWRREGGRLVATPLLVALVVIETTDIVFALDSIPAVLAVTRNPLIVYSSNVMAMLGLRSLYFVLSDAVYRLAISTEWPCGASRVHRREDAGE